jgi:hypothetical protein
LLCGLAGDAEQVAEGGRGVSVLAGPVHRDGELTFGVVQVGQCCADPVRDSIGGVNRPGVSGGFDP